MPRLRGPAISLPPSEERWSYLNEAIFGDPDQGGFQRAPMERALPWSWDKAFDRSAPLMLEIGFNRGRFITALAEQYPENNVVGIEIRKRFGIRLAQQLATAGGPRNLRVIWGDGKVLMNALFQPESIHDMFVTFPDPWWKKRHEKRRLVDTQFAAELAERLCVGGHVWVKSDVPMISEEIKEALISRPELGSLTSFEQDDLPLTHREASCVKKGLPVYRFRLTRNDLPFTGYSEDSNEASSSEE